MKCSLFGLKGLAMLAIWLVSTFSRADYNDIIVKQYDWGGVTPKVYAHEILYYDQGIYDIGGYAKEYAALRGGSSSSVYIANWSSAYNSWRMRYYVKRTKKWVDLPVNMRSAADWWGRKRFGANWVRITGVRVTNPNHPYNWRAAWIVRK